ncbi:MAG: hypothetical protein ACHQJ4_01040 [Ignavibacteria bacterium]
MKIFTLTIFAISLFSLTNLYSQEHSMVEYSWSRYHVKFSLPDYFHVLINTDEEFRAGTDDKQFLFQVFGDLGCACADTDIMKEDLIGAAQNNHLYDYEKNISTSTNSNGLAIVSLAGTKINNQGRETYMSIWVLEHLLYPEKLRVYFSYAQFAIGIIMDMTFMMDYKAFN